MMKLSKNMDIHLRMGLIVLLGFVFFHTQAIAQQHSSMKVSEAITVVDQYMKALLQGDTLTLRSFLDKELLSTKINTFKNHAYSQFLQNLYKNADYEVVDSELKRSNIVSVDVKVNYPNQEGSSFRLWLRDNGSVGLLIFMETEISQ